MRSLALIITLTTVLCLTASAQTGPVTLTEYRQMIYNLAKEPGSKAAIVEALRKRGIDFVLNDGIRSFTRTKSANDDELKRALEEADRRRRDPVSAQLPSTKESSALIETARRNTLEAADQMPDFVVKQQIQRSAAYAGTGNYRNLDRLIVAVSYRASGEENYRVLSVNGVVQNAAETKRSYEEVGGTSSTGEFVTMLSTIFKPESEAHFALVDADEVRGQRALIFEFSVDRDHAKQLVTSAGPGNLTDSTITGMKGRIWIDRALGRVLRVESEATEIPPAFPVRTAKRTIDYDWVLIADEKYLLPSLSDVRLTAREKDKVYESRNVIKFKDYQKFGTDVKILDDDLAPEPEPTPVKP